MNERDYSSTRSTNTKTKTNTNTESDSNTYDLEYNSLLADYGKKTTTDYIERVDEYCERTGKTYSNCYLTIREWLRKDGIKADDTWKYEFVINQFPDVV